MAGCHFLSLAQRRRQVRYALRQNRDGRDSRRPSAVGLEKPAELLLAADVGERGEAERGQVQFEKMGRLAFGASKR